MTRKKSLAKKRPEEVRVNWVVDLVDPPQPVVEAPEPEPQLEPDPEHGEERLSGVNLHLAKALEVATAECSRLSQKGTALAAALEEANKQLQTNQARVQELEGVLKQIASLARSSGPQEQPTEDHGESP